MIGDLADVVVEGRARMAAARMAAGSWPDDDDRRALDRFPDPSLLDPETVTARPRTTATDSPSLTLIPPAGDPPPALF